MRLTTSDWLFESPIDFEHKQWIFFSFLKEIEDDIKEFKVNPSLDQVKYQLSNLEKWKYSKELYHKKTLKGIDFEKMTLVYDIPDDNNPDLKEIDEIVDFCLPYLREFQVKISKLIQRISRDMKWENIGIIPNYKREGYVLIQVEKLIYVYLYKNVINTTFEKIDTFESGLIQNPSWIKLELIKKYNEMPNPNCILVNSNKYPIEESILPVVKLELNKYIYQFRNPDILE